MKTQLILLALIIGVVTCGVVNGIPDLPTLAQPTYFLNDTVEWFPQIIGGFVLLPNYEIDQVSIQNRYGYHLCSGTLISFQTVLTAATCLLNQDGELFDSSEIRVIADDTIIIGEGSDRRQIGDVKNYFTRMTSGIAILELLYSFNETSTLKYRQISNETVLDGQICYVVGWGASPLNMNVRLEMVLVKILSSLMANSSKYYDNELPQTTISTVSMTNACFGDLGGALICDNTVSGILSFGYGCKRPDFPLVFYQTYDDDLIRDFNRRAGGGTNNNGGSIGGTTRPGGGGGSNSGGNNNGIIIIPPGGGSHNNRPNQCNEEIEDDCDGAVVIKLSLIILFFSLLQYI